jgi:hypothetical protein
VLLALGGLVLAGCAPRSLYHWGHYETLVYEMYTAPGKADPAVQVEKLSRDVGEAQTKGLLVPPGVHLHLGYMYFLQGNTTAARAELLTEKQLFPESTVFVDRLLGQMGMP